MTDRLADQASLGRVKHQRPLLLEIILAKAGTLMCPMLATVQTVRFWASHPN